MSPAPDLVDGDTNGTWDVFVHDRLTVTTTRVSVASDGTEGNGPGTSPAISADGRYVAFFSAAFNLVPGDTNGIPEVFVHDCLTGVTERVSVDSAGHQGNNFSGAIGSFHNSCISADGRYVAFGSFASNLVPGDTNGAADVFVHDRLTGVTTRVSVDSDGIQGNDHSAQGDGGPEPPVVSADGRYVAFASAASNLVPDDTNGWWDVFVHDRQPDSDAGVRNDLIACADKWC